MPNHIQNRLQISGTPERVKDVKEFLSGKYDDGTPRAIDFNKIIPMPEGMNIELHSGIETWVEICTGQVNFKSALKRGNSSFGDTWVDKGFDSMINSMKASTALETLMGNRGQTVKEMSSEDFDIFIQCLKNYRNHGFNSWYGWSSKNWGTKWNAYENPDIRDTDNVIHFQTAWAAPVDLIIKLSVIYPEVSFQFDYADEDSGSNAGMVTIERGKKIKIVKPEGQSKEAYDIFFDLHPDRRDEYKLVDNKYEYIEQED